ncbi:MAG: PQQ-binding-like beta-propeller repeat protein, partial [Prolixibacteraceae bacterium]|nr:PQQ-binding-like beta-propeller repeat protein [Prolixibacteraceae bacterium]
MERETKIKIVKRTAIISAIFLIFISVLMLINYFQLTFNDPIESETMKVLIEKLNNEPGNEELIGEIRSFDLIARKAFFTSKWQIETGGILMILSALILIVSLRILSKETSRIDLPIESGLSENDIRKKTSKWILGAGISIFVITIIAYILTINHINKYEAGNTAALVEAEESETIEVVDITVTTKKDTIVVDSTIITKGDTVSTEVYENKEIKNVATLSDIKKQSNSFRGPLGQGVFPAKNITSSWDVTTGSNILWKVKISKKGYNSPVVWNDKIFISGADASERVLYCLSLTGGNILWSHSASGIEGSPAVPPKTTDDTGLAAPTVTTDGNIAVAIFGTGDIVACDFSGNRIWAKNLGVPSNHYGHSSSLIYWNGNVIVQYDSNKGGRLLSLSITDGSIKWDVRRTSRISWASPILAEINGKMQVITSAEPTVAGYDAETGAELWK